jgi:hypothetical protein
MHWHTCNGQWVLIFWDGGSIKNKQSNVEMEKVGYHT